MSYPFPSQTRRELHVTPVSFLRIPHFFTTSNHENTTMTSLDKSKDQSEIPVHRENVDSKDTFSFRSGSPGVDEGMLAPRHPI